MGKLDFLPRGVTPGMACAMAAFGSTYGLDPWQSVWRVHVIEGRPTLAAETMAALVRRSPLCEQWQMVESSARVATFQTRRRGDDAPTRMSYTIEEAQAAGLTVRVPWKAHTAAMLRARCISALARVVYPDLVGGLYDTDEGHEAAGEYREQPQASRIYDIRESPAQVTPPAHRVIEAMPEPRGPRDWWDGWSEAAQASGLAFADALAITRGAGVDTDDEAAVRSAWPGIEAKVRKLSRTQQPSRSREGHGYELTRTAERWRCNCEAGSFGRPCVHAKSADVAWWRGLMAPSAWQTIAVVCGDRPEDGKLDEALGLIRSWRDMMAEEME
jgi:hypothetical protein